MIFDPAPIRMGPSSVAPGATCTRASSVGAPCCLVSGWFPIPSVTCWKRMHPGPIFASPLIASPNPWTNITPGAKSASQWMSEP